MLYLISLGPLSLGAFIEEQGYKAFPSPRQPSPGDWKYFIGQFSSYFLGFLVKERISGLDTVVRHGSRDKGVFDAISVETPREVRIDAGRKTRVRFGRALGRSIGNFYNANYPQSAQLYMVSFPHMALVHTHG